MIARKLESVCKRYYRNVIERWEVEVLNCVSYQIEMPIIKCRTIYRLTNGLRDVSDDIAFPLHKFQFRTRILDSWFNLKTGIHICHLIQSNFNINRKETNVIMRQYNYVLAIIKLYIMTVIKFLCNYLLKLQQQIKYLITLPGKLQEQNSLQFHEAL